MGDPPGRTRNRKGDGIALRDDLFAAGAAILAETGDPGAITIRRVAEVCGVSQAAIYLHFHSRDELVYDLAREAFNDFYDQRYEEITPNRDPVDRIKQLGIAYTDFALANRRLFHVLFMGDGNERDPGRFDGMEILTKTMFGTRVIEEVTEAMRRGQIAPGDPRLVACLLWMSMHGAVALLIALPGYPFPPADFTVAAMVEFTAHAVAEPLGPAFVPRRAAPGGRR